MCSDGTGDCLVPITFACFGIATVIGCAMLFIAYWYTECDCCCDCDFSRLRRKWDEEKRYEEIKARRLEEEARIKAQEVRIAIEKS